MNSYSGYDARARVYEKLNSEISYSDWADFIEKIFARYAEKKPEIVADLACGTGRMTYELASRGYDMIGIDGSPEMLSEAFSKNDGEHSILYLNQDMREFELYGTVGAVSCCLDSINYLLSESDVKKTFSLVHNYLDPDGLFLFDVNTPYKFRHVYGDNAYILEDESSLCAWQNEFDAQSALCRFYLSVFSEQADGTYARADEEQTERCYDLDELTAALDKAGFDLCGAFSDLDFTPLNDTAERWHIVAKTRKTGDWYLCK